MERERRAAAVQKIISRDTELAAATRAANTAIAAMRARWTGGMENVYRVRVSPNGQEIEVACLGLENVDSEAEGIFSSTSQLPEWMQNRLAVLSLMKVEPPQTKVDGIGMRVDENVFWIIRGE